MDSINRKHLSPINDTCGTDIKSRKLEDNDDKKIEEEEAAKRRELIASAAEMRQNSQSESQDRDFVAGSSSFTNSCDDSSDHTLIDQDLSLGTPLTEINRNPDCSLPLSKLRWTHDHSVLFDVNCTLDGEHPPNPYSKEYNDRWDHDHVRLPCSPNQNNCCEQGTENRWNIINNALTSNIRSWKDLKDAILSYNAAKYWDFSILKIFLDELEESERITFFETTLPAMVRLALRLPEICTQPIPFLKQNLTHTITISQLQISSLLANAFFCTFPGRNMPFMNYPTINFTHLFNGTERRNRIERELKNKTEKLKCLLNYFRRVTTEVPCGTVSIKRQHLSDLPLWESSNKRFTRLHVTSEGTIEDNDRMLQVDFANKRIGGGVLRSGCVQEEIRFIICPELIISRLFTAELSDNEAVIITGCERFCSYDGYASTFRYCGDYVDVMSRDTWGRRYVDVLAIDATPFKTKAISQFDEKWLRREVNKAYCGFFSSDVESQNIPPVATGNWGCGAFRGDPHLKTLLQLMAASEAGRDVAYFTFGNADLCRDIYEMHKLLQEKGVTVGYVWEVLNRYGSKYSDSKLKYRPALYDFVRQMVSDHYSDTIT